MKHTQTRTDSKREERRRAIPNARGASWQGAVMVVVVPSLLPSPRRVGDLSIPDFLVSACPKAHAPDRSPPN